MRVMLISSISGSNHVAPLPLGLNLVAVATREAGHDVRMITLPESGDITAMIREAVRESRPDVIGVSARNVDDQNRENPVFLLEPVRDTIAACRAASHATLVVGGAGFSIFPETALRYLKADLGICGEGEVAFTAFLRARERGENLSDIPGICLPGAPVDRVRCPRAWLETLPLPDPSLWSVPADARAEVWVPFQTRRGCPMGCTYCSTPLLEGTVMRKRLIGTVVEGIARHAAAGFRHFYCVDNTFNLPPRYAKDLCASLASAGLGIRFHCILYPGFVDEDLVRKMAEAGCIEASLGFESASPALLRNLNKKYEVEQVRTASELLGKYGIRRTGFLLLGGPGETRESVRESLEFAESLRMEALKVTVGIRIYPGTALEKTAREEGVIAEGDDLLYPRFYVARGLEEWIGPAVRQWMSGRPDCAV